MVSEKSWTSPTVLQYPFRNVPRAQRLSHSRVVVATILALCVLQFLRPNFPTFTTRNLLAPTQPACPLQEGTDRIVVSIQTNAAEASSKIPDLFATSLRCAPNVLVFSDEQETVHGRLYNDVLQDIPMLVKQNNPDFDVYLEKSHENITLQTTNRLRAQKHRSADKSAPNGLDKYKNLQTIQSAWMHQPERDWYIFIDADSHIVWSSLVRWLRQLDPSEKMYIGSSTGTGHKAYAYGGSGYILSRAAMETVSKHGGTITHWNQEAKKSCCGDTMVGRALADLRISLSNSCPSMQAHTIQGMHFSGMNWCMPVVTMHHTSVEAADEFSTFERAREDATVRTCSSSHFTLLDKLTRNSTHRHL